METNVLINPSREYNEDAIPTCNGYMKDVVARGSIFFGDDENKNSRGMIEVFYSHQDRGDVEKENIVILFCQVKD